MDWNDPEVRRVRRLRSDYAAGLVTEAELGPDKEEVLRLEREIVEMSRREEEELGRKLRGGLR